MNLIEALQSEEPVQWECPLYGWTDDWRYETLGNLKDAKFRRKPKLLSEMPWPDEGWITHVFVDEQGYACGSNMEPDKCYGGWLISGDSILSFRWKMLGTGYDTTDWQNSVIEKPRPEGSELEKLRRYRDDTKQVYEMWERDV